MSAEQDVADALQTGLRQLRAGDAAGARAPLRDALEALTPNEDLADFTARAASLLAQAELDAGDPTAARAAAHQAIRILRKLGDADGLTEVRSLDERIGQALAAEKRQRQARDRAQKAAETTIEQLEHQAGSALARADLLLKHVGALRLIDHPDAIPAAERALHWAEQSGQPREIVLAAIALAELGQDAERHLFRALEVADAADETTLIGLVSRAAELAGVTLPTATVGDREVGL